MPVSFEELELRGLCDHLKINYSSVKRYFRDLKDNENMPLGGGLVTDTLAGSTAECERGFSLMNTIISPIWNDLKIDNLPSLMFINLVGPPLDMWNPTKNVRKWVMTRTSADHMEWRERHRKGRRSPIWKVVTTVGYSWYVV